MMLGVTMRGALEKRYGTDDYQRIREALEAFGKVADVTIVALDDPADMDHWNLPPAAGAEAGPILSALRNVRSKIGGKVSTLLVGGDSIIPFWRFANPVADRSIDPDEEVLSDNPYGANADDG
jgi:hypothetical protein